MRLEHHLVGGYVRYISPHIIIIINESIIIIVSYMKPGVYVYNYDTRIVRAIEFDLHV